MDVLDATKNPVTYNYYTSHEVQDRASRPHLYSAQDVCENGKFVELALSVISVDDLKPVYQSKIKTTLNAFRTRTRDGGEHVVNPLPVGTALAKCAKRAAKNWPARARDNKVATHPLQDQLFFNSKSET